MDENEQWRLLGCIESKVTLLLKRQDQTDKKLDRLAPLVGEFAACRTKHQEISARHTERLNAHEALVNQGRGAAKVVRVFWSVSGALIGALGVLKGRDWAYAMWAWIIE